MDIKIGKIYQNKTWNFLVPCLQYYGEDFTAKFNRVKKLAAGIEDTLLNNLSFQKEKLVYLLLDRKVNPKAFENFLNFVKNREYYVTDYCSDIDLKHSRRHMVVLRIPKELHSTYNNFLTGNYSKMYSEEQLDLFFKNPTKKETLEVLRRQKEALNRFMIIVNKEFSTYIPKSYLEKGEYALPLKKEEETFNYIKGKEIFFNSNIKYDEEE